MSEHAKETVEYVNATMALEGMPLSEQDIEMVVKISEGELTIEEAIAILNDRFSKDER